MISARIMFGGASVFCSVFAFILLVDLQTHENSLVMGIGFAVMAYAMGVAAIVDWRRGSRVSLTIDGDLVRVSGYYTVKEFRLSEIRWVEDDGDRMLVVLEGRKVEIGNYYFDSLEQRKKIHDLLARR